MLGLINLKSPKTVLLRSPVPYQPAPSEDDTGVNLGTCQGYDPLTLHACASYWPLLRSY